MPTYYTVADAQFFLGAVGLVNSLRLKRNLGEIVVLDAGLTPEQRRLLEQECNLVDIPEALAGHHVFFKPYVSQLEPEGVVVLVDSDIIVTADLAEIIDRAAGGAICGFRDHEASRWFSEWQALFRLGTPPRRQAYTNAGFIAVSVDHWPRFLDRWWECSEMIRIERSQQPFGLGIERARLNPVAFNEQDVLNALLTTEVPAEAQYIEDIARAPVTYMSDEVRVVDTRSLACLHATGQATLLLHHVDHPKPWYPLAWTQFRFDAYVRLLGRLLTADDVALKLPSALVPTWLRAGAAGTVARPMLGTTGRLLMGVTQALPPSVKATVLTLGRAARRRVRKA